MNSLKRKPPSVGEDGLGKCSKKQDTNIKSNSTLYFQIGLILSLLITYALFEMNFKQHDFVYEPTELEEEYIDYVTLLPTVKMEQPVNKTVTQKKVKEPKFEEVPDDTDLKETLRRELITELPKANEFIPDLTFDMPDDPVDDDLPVDFFIIEEAPIYPGCENTKTKAERKQCMSKKISKLINRKFNNSLASELGLQKGEQRIDVNFRIDKTGKITQIKARGPHPKLEKEAIRVTNKLPQMVPGRQRDRVVEVIYNLPIVLQVY